MRGRSAQGVGWICLDRQIGRQWKKKERDNERPALLAAFLFFFSSLFFPFFSFFYKQQQLFQKMQELSFQHANDRKGPSFMPEEII